MTLAELRARVYTLLAEDSDSDRISPATVDWSINAGYRELATRANAFAATVTIAAVDEQSDYTVPSNMYAIDQVLYDDIALEMTYPGILDRTEPEWRVAASGNPSHWLRQDTRTITIYPAPNVEEATNIIVIGHVAPLSGDEDLPTLTQESDSPLLPNAVHGALACYAVVDLASIVLADDPAAQARAQACFTRFQAAVQELSAYLGGS